MKNHTKVYLKYFGYSGYEYMPCEIEGCHRPAVDINHIKARGMGGSKHRDNIENLMGMCREHHLEYGDKKQHRDMLIEQHKKFMRENGNETNTSIAD